MADARARAQAHANRAHYCKCGRVVHGNGAKAMHFYVRGDQYAGRREGHELIGREAYLKLHGRPSDHPANQKRRRLG